MNTKENVREQLQEKNWTDLQAIMCEFFVSQANSWQAELLDWLLDELPDAVWQARDKMIDKIIAEVSVEDLVEGGWIDRPPRMVYVKWDTDGEDVDDLPSEVEIPYDVDEDDIADMLSDEFGYCVSSFSFE